MIEKPPSRAFERRERSKQKLLQLRRVRQAVLVRDGYRCRVCRRRDDVDMHHLKFRSAGGGTDTANCLALCRCCHDAIHAYRLTLSGNANGKLTIDWRA